MHQEDKTQKKPHWGLILYPQIILFFPFLQLKNNNYILYNYKYVTINKPDHELLYTLYLTEVTKRERAAVRARDQGTDGDVADLPNKYSDVP